MTTGPTFADLAQGLRCGQPNCPCQRTNGTQAVVHCPAHDDQHPSLSVTDKNGKLLVSCKTGCPQDAVIDALRVRGLWGEKPAERRVVARFDYKNADGDLLYQVERLEGDDHKRDGVRNKTFRVRRPDGHGGWVYRLDNVPRVLYRLPELMATDATTPVFVVEGEAKADAMLALSLLATCNPGGAGKWAVTYSETLRGRHVVVLPDRDETGRSHAETVAKSLRSAAASVKILPLPDLPDRGDVVDWIAAGGTRAQLVALVADAPDWEPEPSGPQVVRAGDGFSFSWTRHGIAVRVDQLHEHSDGLSGEITVEASVGGVIHWARFNVASTQARESLVKKLMHIRDDVPWRELLERVCRETAERFRIGAPIEPLIAGTSAAPRELVEKLIPDGEIAVLFGDGGAGKSTLALALAVSVVTGRGLPHGFRPTRTAKVLYLDWEGSRDDLSERLASLEVGLGLDEVSGLFYRPMSRALADDITFLRAEVSRLDIGFVIVDSLAPACGAEPETADSVVRAMNAMRSFGVSCLAVAHVSKVHAEAKHGTGRPFGSVFVWNLARSVWELRRSDDTEGNDVAVGLFHRKCNRGRLHPACGLRFEYTVDGACRIMAQDLGESSDLAARMSLGFQIRNFLARGAHTAQDLAEKIDTSAGTVRKELSRLRSRGVVVELPGDEREKRWGLPDQRSSDVQ